MCRQCSILYVAVLLLCSAGLAEAGDVIVQCDAGDGALQAGWTRVLKGTNVNVAGTGINVTLATGAPTAIAGRDTGGSGTLADVETDFYFADNQTESPGSDFILTLSNLTPGMPYRLLSYHNRSNEGDTTIPGVTVTGTTVIIAPSTILQTHAIMDDPAEFIFVADSSTVSIRYQGPDGGCAGCQAFFNGFQLEYGSPAISFAAESSGGVETMTPAMIAVNLNNPEPGQTYTVDYRVIGGTAEGDGVDYYLVEPNTLTFSPGQTSKYIVIDINSDGVQEPDETIVLELSNVTGPDCVLGISQHTYTISDGPPRVSFLQAGDTGSENVASATIPVVLSHATDQTVTVDYEVTGGTATSGGVDYYLFEPNTMTFNPGQTSKIISIDIIEDDEKEDDETINLTLSNAYNGVLSSPTTHTYTIIDNEEGVRWNGTTWYYSAVPNNNLFVNPQGKLEWIPETEQYITRIPDRDLSDKYDVVEISYWWMSDGDHDCLDCFACPDGCYDDDITCIAGTSDIRVGLFEADGEYVQADGLGVSNSIFNGYKGYQFRFGPNMMAGPTRWVDCTEETHRTGQIKKKDVSFSDLLSSNDHPTLIDLPGFELPPGEWTLFTMRLERLPDVSSVEVTMTFNGRTYSSTDGSTSGQPTKIDVLAVYMRNSRPYTALVLDNVCEAVGDADFDGDDVVDENDLKVIADDWLEEGTSELRGTAPDGSGLILHYAFEGTSGQDITSVPELSGSGVGPLARFSEASAGDLEYGESNPWTDSGTSADFQNTSNDPGTALYAEHHSVLNLNLGEFTISAFIKPRSLRQSVIIRKRDGGSGEWYLDLRDDGRIGFTAHDDDHVMFSSAPVQADNWYHVAAVFDEDAADGKPMKLYINGALSNHAAHALRPASTSEPLGVGCIIRGSTSNTGQFFDGLIDELKIYDYALSEDEVVYEANNGPTIIYTPPDSPANLYPDEIIDFQDFAAFASLWSQSCQ